MTSVSNKSTPVVQALSNCQTLTPSSLRMETVTSPVTTTGKAIATTSGPASALARKRRLELLRSSRLSSSSEHNLKSSASVKRKAKGARGTGTKANKKKKTDGNDVKKSAISASKIYNCKGKESGKNNTDELSNAQTKTPSKPKRKVKTNIRYDPDVPMSKEETAAWRREARRVRNRESAAASRQKTKTRIEELENELKKWKEKYNEAQTLLLEAHSQGFSNMPLVLNSNQTQDYRNHSAIPQLDPTFNNISVSVSIPQLQEIKVHINQQTNNNEQQQSQKLGNHVLPSNEVQSYITTANSNQFEKPSTSHALSLKAYPGISTNDKGPTKTDATSMNANVIANANANANANKSGNTSQTVETALTPATMALPSLLQVLSDEHERVSAATGASTTTASNLEQNTTEMTTKISPLESKLKNDGSNNHGVQDSTICHEKQIDNNENQNQDGDEKPRISASV